MSNIHLSKQQNDENDACSSALLRITNDEQVFLDIDQENDASVGMPNKENMEQRAVRVQQTPTTAITTRMHAKNSFATDTDVLSNSSDNSWFDFTFEATSDEHRFNLMCYMLQMLVYAYAFCACTNFYSSFYPVTVISNNSTTKYVSVDSLLMTTNIMSIDISSAIFIISGFLSTYMSHNMRADELAELFKIIMIYSVIDLWLSTSISLLFGSIFHLVHHSFKVKDMCLTLLHGLSGIQVFAWNQNSEAWHSWNPTMWPVGTLLWSFVLLRFTIRANTQIKNCHERTGPYLILLNAILPIFLLSLFALLRDDTNIFFANATNFGYRLLEFNLGVAVYCTLQTHVQFVMHVLRLLNTCSVFIFFAFFLLWFAELGVPVHKHMTTCIRMYTFSPCIKAHHGFLMRGCLLGLALLSRTVADEQVSPALPSLLCIPSMKTRHVAPLLSVVAFIWPLCYIISLMLQINTSRSMVQDNAALLLFVTPSLAFVLAYIWNAKMKPKVFYFVETVLQTCWARMKRSSETEAA